MMAEITWTQNGPIAIYHCCRDWPCNTLARIGRCGLCGEVPERSDKTVEQYMAERQTGSDDGP